MHYTKEIMNDSFIKHHLGFDGFTAVAHEFKAEHRDLPHDHPFSFITHILTGGYVEKIYHIRKDGTWHYDIINRLSGTSHRVDSRTIHEIIELPRGKCWTLIIPEQKEREPRFWRFDENGIASRAWNEEEFTPFIIKVS